MKTIPHCLECGIPVSWGVHLFSRRIYGHCLCIKDQCMIEESGATAHVVDLYLGLKAAGIPVVLRHFDGCQYADIVLPGKLYITVKGPFSKERNQNMTDLFRNMDSGQKRFLTIHISNAILQNPDTFDLALKEIAKICRKLMKKKVFTGMQFSFSPAQWQ